MAQESFLKWLNSSFIGISAFKCHFMWRVDLLTGGSSFLYQSMCVIMTQVPIFFLSALRRHVRSPSVSLVLSADRGSAHPVLSVDPCRTIPPLCLAKSEFTVAQSFAPEGNSRRFRDADSNRSRPVLIPLSLGNLCLYPVSLSESLHLGCRWK